MDDDDLRISGRRYESNGAGILDIVILGGFLFGLMALGMWFIASRV